MVKIFIWHNPITYKTWLQNHWVRKSTSSIKSMPAENKGAVLDPELIQKSTIYIKVRLLLLLIQLHLIFLKKYRVKQKKCAINRTLFSKWNQGVFGITLPKSLSLARLLLNNALKFAWFIINHFRTWQSGRFFRHTYVRYAIFLFFTRIICRLHTAHNLHTEFIFLFVKRDLNAFCDGN